MLLRIGCDEGVDRHAGGLTFRAPLAPQQRGSHEAERRGNADGHERLRDDCVRQGIPDPRRLLKGRLYSAGAIRCTARGLAPVMRAAADRFFVTIWTFLSVLYGQRRGARLPRQGIPVEILRRVRVIGRSSHGIASANALTREARPAFRRGTRTRAIGVLCATGGNRETLLRAN